MYTLCTTEKAALQQRRIEACFLNLYLENPYDTITVSQICRDAGLSRKTFYRLFDQKADVLYALIDHTLLDYQDFQPDASVGPGGVHFFFAFWREHKRLLDALERNQVNFLLTERSIYHVLREDTDVLRYFGIGSEALDRDALLFYISGIFALVLNWHSQGYARSIDDMSQLLMTLLHTPPVKQPLMRDF